MSYQDLDIRPFYTFPATLRGALKVVPYFQVLIYLPFLLQGFEVSAFAVSVAGHLLLYPLFFRVFWCKGYGAAPLVLVMALLAFAVSAYSLSGIVFFAFAAAACAACRNNRQSYILLLGVNGLYLLAAYVFAHSIYIVLVALFFTGINGLSFNYQLGKYYADRLIKQSQEEVSALATIAERERIARDLHDLLGNSLTSVTLKAELAERLVDLDPHLARQHLKEIQEISRLALSQVREAVADYKKNTFENELSNARVVLESKDVELIHDISPLDIDPPTDAALAMILREATTNMLRHSDATSCRVTLKSQVGQLVLSICDNGRPIPEPSMGNGLKGMAERCHALGGVFNVSFLTGCNITATFPTTSAGLGGQV